MQKAFNTKQKQNRLSNMRKILKKKKVKLITVPARSANIVSAQISYQISEHWSNLGQTFF